MMGLKMYTLGAVLSRNYPPQVMFDDVFTGVEAANT